MTREEAIRIIRKMLACTDLSVRANLNADMVDACHLAIKALEQEPRKGYWRPIYQGDEIIDYRCSECEFGSTFGKSTYGMNYCPHCGAKMVELQESE